MELSHKDEFLCEFKVKFEPQVDEILRRHNYLNCHPAIKEKPKLYNGERLLIPSVKELEDFTTEDDVKISFDLIEVKEFGDPASLRLFNVLLNRTFKVCTQYLYQEIFQFFHGFNLLQVMGLFPIKSGQIGQRSFYNPLSKVELRKHQLEIWPGYIAAIEKYDGGVYLVFDNSSKIIRNETVADIIATCLKNNPKEFRNEVTKAVIGKSVITRYTNKTYKIDEIDFEKTPEDSFQRADGSTVTFKDFYKVRQIIY